MAKYVDNDKLVEEILKYKNEILKFNVLIEQMKMAKKINFPPQPRGK